jgi:hypothetical protein
MHDRLLGAAPSRLDRLTLYPREHLKGELGSRLAAALATVAS